MIFIEEGEAVGFEGHASEEILPFQDEKTLEFIGKARAKYGDVYGYEKVIYKNNQTPVEIVCPIHGSFFQTPKAHLRRGSCGCPNCGRLRKISASTSDTETFIQKALLAHPNEGYDYSRVKYVNGRTPVEIGCPLHGLFRQKPENHLQSHGCPKCGCKKNNANRQLTTEEFIRKASAVHDGVYDYSKANYVNSNRKVEIICTKHGSFHQRAIDHLKGRGCPKCGVESGSRIRALTTTEFIGKAKEIHSDEYDYSKVKYKNCSTPVIIICRKHGEFQQTPNKHLMGHGCPTCNSKERLTTDAFISKARAVNGDEYDYSKVKYKNCSTPVIIICRKHGEFLQRPQHHLNGGGCPECSRVSSAKYYFPSQEGPLLYGIDEIADHYGKSPTELRSRVFRGIDLKTALAMPSSLKVSQGEYMVQEKLNSMNITFIYNKTVKMIFETMGKTKEEYKRFDMKVKQDLVKAGYTAHKTKKYRYDFALLSDGKGKIVGFIEVDGKQHFEWVRIFFKTLEEFLFRVADDHEKTAMSEVMRIPLLRIRYDQLDVETVSDIIDDFWHSIQKGDGRYLIQHNPYLTNEEYWEEANMFVKELALENA